AVVGGRQLAIFRDRAAATHGVVAGKAIYLSPSFNGSGWIQVDPESLKDVSTKPLLDIGYSSTNSSETQVSADGSTIIVSDFSPTGVTRRVYDGRTGQLRGYFVPEVAMVLEYLSADGTLGLGRVGDNRSPRDGESVLVTIPEGHVVRRLFAIDIPGEVQAAAVAVHKKTSLLDPFAPLVAEAKTVNDEERQAMAFTPDGSGLIGWVTATHYDDINGATRTTRTIQRIDVATGTITAEASPPEGIY